MLPVIALVGRPNVGKSTLFNQLTKSKEALVLDEPGVTRDRLYGQGRVGDRPYIVIDTAGIGAEENALDNLTAEQTWQAIEEAEAVLFMVDARVGITAVDKALSQKLHTLTKPLYVVVNKTDGLNIDTALPEFYELGFKKVIPIAASHGRGIQQLMDHVLSACPSDEQEALQQDTIKVALIGRPNVGKSTLMNRFLGEERVVVFDAPGTTRDSIYIPLERMGQHYTFIDTAGVRRRARIEAALEKFSVIKTLKAIEDSHVVLFIMNAREGVTDQDLNLLGYVLEAGKSLVVAVNKWDNLNESDRKAIKQALQYRLQFIVYAKVHFISALHGSGVGNLYASIRAAFRAATRPLPTHQLTQVLTEALVKHPPPLVNGRRIKLRYAHSGGHNPPQIIIHGNQTERVPETYKRYLANYFREALRLVGTPIRINFKTGKNPYASKKNTLTPRQLRKRERIRH